jgi:hypothetical protein
MATSATPNVLEVTMRNFAPTMFVVLLLCLIVATVACTAAERGTVITRPEKAGVDYKLQGEYLGEHDSDEGKRKIGIQVIALGDGDFQAVAYVGGLPGEGWTRKDEKYTGEGQLKEGQVEFTPADSDGNTTASLKDDTITVFEDKQPIAELRKVERKSKTLGEKPPKEAIVLFDGSSLDEWDNAKLVEGKLLGATAASTKRKFGDHSLHIEFRTPFMPEARGQGRGNSGVYIQGRYEVQVLDSFGLEGEDNECGGIYSIAKPAVNMCYPPLAWQTYDIDFTAARYDESGKKTKNARATIKHNGVVIHDDLELTQGTPGHDAEGPEPNSLFLQDHGNPVAYRNIWVVEK